MLDQQIARELARQVGPDRWIGETRVEASSVDVAEVAQEAEQAAGHRDEVGDHLSDIDRTVVGRVEPSDELFALFDEVDDRGGQLEVGQGGGLHRALVAQIAGGAGRTQQDSPTLSASGARVPISRRATEPVAAAVIVASRPADRRPTSGRRRIGCR